MPTSNQGDHGSSGALRSAGRNFVSTDPERQREVAADGIRARDERHSAHAMQARPARGSLQLTRSHAALDRSFPQRDSDDEGGSGRRGR